MELDFCGVYRLSKDGKLTLLTKEMTKPNGIAFSPDEKTLYVSNSDPQKAVWMAFDVKEDGTLGKGRVFFDNSKWAADKTKKGLPDGMKVDKDGNLFATGAGRPLRDYAAGQAVGRDRHGRGDRQLQLGRRRLDAVHLRRTTPDAHQDKDQGQRLG